MPSPSCRRNCRAACASALASRARVPVTPRAAGTGLSGGAIPDFGGIVLSCDRMDRLLELDEDDLMAVVQPGLVTERLQTAVEAYAIDKRHYPVAQSITELKSLVQPTYIVTTPLTDNWDTGFRYVLSADGKSYQIVSAGSDKVFDDSSWESPGLLESSKEDAVDCANED